MSADLKRCPCGEIPTSLQITDNGQGAKWANVSGDCCGEWMIEVRTSYYSLDSDECMQCAIEGWNMANRCFE